MNANGNGNDDTPITDRGETDRPGVPSDNGDHFIQKLVGRIEHACVGVDNLREEFREAREINERMRASMQQLDASVTALGRMLQHLSVQTNGNLLAMAETLKGNRAELGLVLESQGRLLAELGGVSKRLEWIESRGADSTGKQAVEAVIRRASLLDEEELASKKQERELSAEKRRHAWWLAAKIAAAFALATIAWIFGRGGHP